MAAHGEKQPLVGDPPLRPITGRLGVYNFVERNKFYLTFTTALIILNIVTFMLGTEENVSASASSFFDLVEVVTVAIFTVDYLLRLYSIAETRDNDGNPIYAGFCGRLRYVCTDFFALVDLASILPFYIDIFYTGDLPATQFIRLFRLLRMMKAEPRFFEAFCTFDDIYRENKRLLITSGFVGFTTWIIISSFQYLAERDNPNMIWDYPTCYNPYAEDAGDDDDTGSNDSSLPLCPHRFSSILSSSYFVLLNLFGEFPLIADHSPWGRVIGTFTAVVAVAVFAIPTGVFGSGFEDMMRQRKEKLATFDAAADVPDGDGGGSDSGGGGRYGGTDSKDSGDGDRESASSGLLVPAAGAKKDGNATATGLDGMLAGATPSGKLYEASLFAVVALSVVSFMVSTVPAIQKRSNMAEAPLAWIEVACVISLTGDYALRLLAAWRGGDSGDGALGGCFAYALSFYGLVDLLSVLPTLAGLAATGGSVNVLSTSTKAVALRFVRLIRMLKVERYTRAFSVFDDVLRENVDILAVSGFMAVVILVFASTLMYYAERNNPDPDMAAYYTSIPNAMWVTLLNLSGEAPLCDYTMWGKLITGVLGCVAVGVFAIPVGLIGAGYEAWIEEIDDAVEADAAAVENAMDGAERAVGAAKPAGTAPAVEWALPPAGGGNGGGNGGGSGLAWRDRLFAFVTGRTPHGRTFEGLVLFAIVLSVADAILQTATVLCPSEDECPAVLDWIELLAVIFFTFEYFLRLLAAPSDPDLVGSWGGCCWARVAFIFSFYGVIDALSVFPYYLAKVSTTVDEYDDYLRLLRLLRLLKMDKYVPSISLIDDVFRLKRRGLLVSGCATLTMWLGFASALYLAERKDGTQADCLTEAQRFRSVPNALQYDLILLTGDYPLIDFTLWGRLVNVLQIVVAVGVVGVPSGLIAGGFTEVLAKSKAENRARRRQAAVLLQRQARGFLARRNFLLAVKGAQELEKKREERAAAAAEAEKGLRPTLRAEKHVFSFISGKTWAGGWFRGFVGVLIILNVVAVVVESEPGNDDDENLQAIFDGFEAFSVVIFTGDLLARLFSAPLSPKYDFSRIGYLTSFFGIVDLGTVVPWYVQALVASSSTAFDASAFRVLRLFRILQLEHFVEAFTLLDDVWRGCRDVLAATGLLALMVWVGSACLFYLFERGNPCTDDAFASIPMSLYYTGIFLGGEWGTVDFTVCGKALCCTLCVVGIALFAIPVGTIFESFSDVLAEGKEGDEEAEAASATADKK